MGAVYKPVEKFYKKKVLGQKPKAPTQTASPATGAGRGVDEEPEAVLETGAGQMRRRRRGKRALIVQPAAAQVGGEGVSGLNIPK